MNNKPTLYEWQKEALNDPHNDYALWVCEAGTGKSHAAGLWLQQKERSTNAVILGPKQIRDDWKKRTPEGQYFTPQTILKEQLPVGPSAIVVDEADMFASPLFLATKRSKCTAKLYEYIKANPKTHVLLLTATPVRSTPWNIHTLLTYIQQYIDWKTYRGEYFALEYKPYIPRPAWFPVVGWQRKMQPLIDNNCTVALMKDMVDYLPPETYKIIDIKPPNYENNIEWEATRQFVEDHRLEQDKKLSEIKSIAKRHRKVALVVHYREQIDALSKKLSSERECFILDGRTKDPAEVIKAAEDSDECYFIIQASVGAGFEIPSFACMIFASQGYSTRNYVQMKARIRRINALKPVIYYFLHGGRCDKMVYNSIQAGKDFIPSEYKQ